MNGKVAWVQVSAQAKDRKWMCHVVKGAQCGRVMQSASPPQCEIDVGGVISVRIYSELLQAEQPRAQESFLRHSWSDSSNAVDPRRECGLSRAVFLGRCRNPVEG